MISSRCANLFLSPMSTSSWRRRPRVRLFRDSDEHSDGSGDDGRNATEPAVAAVSGDGAKSLPLLPHDCGESEWKCEMNLYMGWRSEKIGKKGEAMNSNEGTIHSEGRGEQGPANTTQSDAAKSRTKDESKPELSIGWERERHTLMKRLAQREAASSRELAQHIEVSGETLGW